MTVSVPRMWLAAAALALVAAAFASSPGTARAGTYTVLACHDGGAAGTFANQSWDEFYSHPSEFKDAPFGWENCSGPGAGTVGLFTSSTRLWNGNSWAGWQFRAPNLTTISDFSLRRELYYYNPTVGNAGANPRLYIAGRFSGDVYEGAGEHNTTTTNTLRGSGRWYGWPPGTAAYDAPRWITKESWGLRGFSGSSLSFEVGCYTDVCEMASGGLIYFRVHDALVTVNDTAVPTSAVQPGRGLTTGGPRRGDEPVYFTVGDTAGVAKVELREGNTVLASEDYRTTETDSGIRCNFAYSAPCPTKSDPGVLFPGLFGPDEKLDHARLPAGAHQLKLRATDTAGNTADSPPFNVDVTSLPVSNQQPTVTGQALQGATLTAHDGLWDGDPPPTVTRRWQRCDTSGENCTDIPGAVGPQYTLTPADVGNRIRLLVTATNTLGSTARASEVTDVVRVPEEIRVDPPPEQVRVDPSPPDAAASRSRGQANGQGAADNAQLAISFAGGAKEAGAPYGQRAELEGKLTDAAGRPIAGAALRLVGQPLAPGLPPAEADTATTDANGAFRYGSPPGPSRLIRASYRAFSEDRTASAEAEVRLIVQATGTLKAKPSKVRNGRPVTFTGRAMPAQAGVPVEIQAMGSRKAGWQKVVVLKTGRAGNYRFRYRFRRTPKTYTYRFRVVVGPVAQQAQEYGMAWIPYIQPGEQPPRRYAVCLPDTGVNVTPDTPPDSPAGPIVFRGALDGGSGLGATDEAHLHGTHMGMFMGASANGWGDIGMWPGVPILSVRAVRYDQQFFVGDDYRCGVNWCLRPSVYPIAVINLSLGCNCILTGQPLADLEDQIAQAHEEGVSVVAAAGNTAGQGVESPANASGVFAVAAGGRGGQLCPKASFDTRVGVIGPGCDLEHANPMTGEPNSNYTGSSFATAAVSTMIALLRSYRPDATPAQIEAWIRQGSRRVGDIPVLDGAAAARAAGLGAIVDRAQVALAADAAAPTSMSPRSGAIDSDATVIERPVDLPTPRAQARWRRKTLFVKVKNRPPGVRVEVAAFRDSRHRDFSSRGLGRRTRMANSLHFRVSKRPDRIQVRFLAIRDQSNSPAVELRLRRNGRYG